VESAVARRGLGYQELEYKVAASIVLSAYATIIALSASTFPGDTRDYANSIVARHAGRDLYFWEFGHLLWRPLGYLLVLVSRPFRVGIAEQSEYLVAVHSLIAISIVAGAIALLAFLAWVIRLRVPRTTAVAATLAMAMSCALLNYAQTGTAYLPALAMLCVGLWAIARADDNPSSRLPLAASALAASVLLWLPMVLAVPAACASPMLLRGDNASRRRASCKTFVLTTIIVAVAYIIVVLIKGVDSASALTAWMSAASHGIRDSAGVARASVGFARSIVSSDQLGIIAKRHMLGDPFNPASIRDVVRGGLYRFALFYFSGLIIVTVLVRSLAGRRTLLFLAISALPVLALAVLWQGGDLERYLALFPAIFLTVATALAMLPRRTYAVSGAILVVGLFALNMPDYLRSRSDLTCARLARRLSAIPRDAGKKALVVTPLNSDELTQVRGLCPDVSLLEDANSPNVIGLVTPHESSAPSWRRVFAANVAKAWRAGARVWVSKRAFVAKPAAQWVWTEGDEPRVHWRDFPTFFRALQHSEPRGVDDEFVEIPPSPRNIAIVNALTGSTLTSKQPFVVATPRDR
jgi:hypothetical protein